MNGGDESMAFENPSRDEIRQILADCRNIAVVGLSEDPGKTSHMVAKAMQERGYRIIPVNPTAAGRKILGETCYASLGDIPEQVDLVNVFRRSEYTPEVAEQAVQAGARTLWLQLGIYNEEAAEIARRGGLNVIMDRCIKVEEAVLRPRG